MKALRFENNKLKLAEIEKPHRTNEALIRVVKSGICNTDLEIVRGLKEGKINVETLISDEFPLSGGIKAMEKAGRKNMMKVLLSMTD